MRYMRSEGWGGKRCRLGVYNKCNWEFAINSLNLTKTFSLKLVAEIIILLSCSSNVAFCSELKFQELA